MKTTQTSPTASRRAQRGQSMVEYAVICGVLAAALFAPIPGTQPQQAAGAFLAGKIRDFYNDLTYFISLP